MLSGSSSTQSSRHGRARSQDASSQDTRSYDTRSYDDYLGENLLEEVPAQYSSVKPRPINPFKLPPSSSRLDYEDSGSFRHVIAIDYGTTFTGVAFATTKSDLAHLEGVEIIRNWGPQMTNADKIPSVISYSPATRGERQWGADISPHAVTMLNTKMELEVQDTKLDELDLILQVLEGTGNLSFDTVRRSGGFPDYTWKTPQEIVADYLTKVFEHVYQVTDGLTRAFENVYQGSDLDIPLKSKHPVDIVVTVPVKWSYRATNSTLRALKQAGFNEENFPSLNEIILVTEPEAASIYTARYLKEDKRTEFLKLGECFVLCDAGGGTVDVISYQVKQLEPNLELDQVTYSTSDKCGAAYINVSFKRWLNKVLGDRSYRELDPKSAGQRVGSHTTEGEHMRELIQRFEVQKKIFSNNETKVIKLDLPGALSKLTIPGRVREGELIISPEEMKAIFNPCVNKVVELISGQRQQVERKGRRVKNVFLVGGFGESPYLQEELDKSLGMRKIRMRRPDKTSWTAVVRGAVMYGIEKSRYKKVRLMSTSVRSYGIVIDEAFSIYKSDQRDRYTDSLTNGMMARKQLAWLVRKGDLILSDEKKVSEKEFTFTFRASDSRKFNLPVYVYPDDDDDVPDRWETGQHEIEEVGVVRCDISHYSTDDFDQRQNHNTGEKYYIAHLICRMELSLSTLDVEVLVNATKIGHIQIVTGDDALRRSSLESWAQ